MHFLDEGPSVVHEGAHIADFLQFLSNGHPAQVAAVGLRSRPEFPSENFAAAVVTFDNGDIARVEVGWFFPYMLRGDFRVWGPHGVAELNRPERWVQLHTQTELFREDMGADWNCACFDAQLTHFLNCMATRQEPETSTKAGIASLRLTTAIVESFRTQQPVVLPRTGTA
jgi:predicted dehydrogenase